MLRMQLALLVLMFVSPACSANAFCGNAPFVPFDQLAMNAKSMLNKRVRTRAVGTTDAKEYTRYRQDELSPEGLLQTADSESTRYAEAMKLSPPAFDVREELFRLLRIAEGDRYKPDLAKIRYYREDVMLCGRVVRTWGMFEFAVDDLIRERTYLLLPQRSAKKSRR
jgi:hypothetical protein